MNETFKIEITHSAASSVQRPSRRRPWSWHLGRWRVGQWQLALAALLALLAVEGQSTAAFSATTRPAQNAERAAGVQAGPVADTSAADDRPDFRVTFADLDEAQAGRPFSYTIQVRNDGGDASTASVSAVLPPELSNVRVTAPGFVCTRRFSASGAQAGTLVACLRNDLEGGAVADVTIEAQAPSAAGTYRLTAVADPRDEVAESDEANNEAGATIRVHA